MSGSCHAARAALWAAALAALALADEFDRFDLNHDNTLSREEFERFELSMHTLVNTTFGAPSKAGDLGHVLGFWPAFVNSLMMIWATEVGDKTFFIAAIMAMSNSRIAVFSGAIAALAVMTVLSAAMGFALPNLIPRELTHYVAAFLFLYFGLKLLYDSREMEAGAPSDELAEAEEELAKQGQEVDLEGQAGKGHPSPRPGEKGSPSSDFQVLMQSFTLTFLAEWGDRSQIATIALASAKDPYGVTVGGILGHSMCTGLAVLGGRYLASRISEKTVTIVGGVLFLLFAAHSFIFGVS